MTRPRALLPALVALALAAPAAGASCADPILPLEVVRPQVLATWNALATRRVFPWGTAHVWGKIEGVRIQMALPFERLTAEDKRKAIDMLHLGGLPATLHLPTGYDELTQAERMTPFEVFAHDGRVLSLPYDGCTRAYFFTEWDRQRMRWTTRTPPARKMRFPLPDAIQQEVSTLFWSIVGRRQPDVVNFAWIPESGHYEIVVSKEARWRYRNRVGYFWLQAPWDLHYVVLDTDGAWLEERGVLPAIWPWGVGLVPFVSY